MDTFLGRVAHTIASRYPHDTDGVLVVFNNNRSKRQFLRQFEGMGQAMFLPKVATIDEVVSDLGKLEIVPGEFLLFELYNIHVALGGSDRKYATFEDFISFGDLMLSDFSEVDQYMVDAARLFSYIHDEKTLGEWDVEGKELTEFQRRYLEFYRSLHEYYTRLRRCLLEQGKAYSGMAYRHVAENIEALAEARRWQAVYFIGFNAMSECERRIIGHYVRQGVGHTMTDYDSYYLDEEQEAGLFLRRHMEEFPELRPTGNSLFASKPRSITIVECPENLLQCKYAAKLLSEKLTDATSTELEQTAVVLADEGLLMPVLNSLPELAKDFSVNISMGYAYSDSVVHRLVLKTLALYRQMDERGYYHTDLLALLANRYIADLAGGPGLHSKVERFLRESKRIRCTAADLLAWLPDCGIEFLFPDHVPSPGECLDIVRQMAALLASLPSLTDNRKETQALGSLVLVLDNLARLDAQYPFITNIDTLEKIYSRLALHHQITLIGEPMAGLQILGMLETRNLDFKRVILLTANEGILPGGRGNNTLIPLSLKHEMHLPTYAEKDSVYAYNFYRLLQRCEEAYLVYHSDKTGLGKGEASRFLRQVECELAPRFGIALRHLSVAADTSLTTPPPSPMGRKGERIMQRLSDMASQGLYPTSFAHYIECPMKFYFTQVLKVAESRTLEDDLDNAELGTIIHNVLQCIYEPHIGHPLPAEALKEALATIDERVENEFARYYAHGRNTEGHNRFYLSVALGQISNLLQKELASIQRGDDLHIMATEQKLGPYPIRLASGHFVNINGKVDRVDTLNGRVRVIDYKSGRVADQDLSFADPMPGKWLQIMWYALLYARKHSDVVSLSAGIYPLKDFRSGVHLATWDGDTLITPDRIERFETLLREKMEELMNPAIDFVAEPQKNACPYCPAKGFCQDAVS